MYELTQHLENGLEKANTFLTNINNHSPLNIFIICGTAIAIAIVICHSDKEISVDNGKITIKPIPQKQHI